MYPSLFNDSANKHTKQPNWTNCKLPLKLTGCALPSFTVFRSFQTNHHKVTEGFTCAPSPVPFQPSGGNEFLGFTAFLAPEQHDRLHLSVPLLIVDSVRLWCILPACSYHRLDIRLYFSSLPRIRRLPLWTTCVGRASRRATQPRGIAGGFSTKYNGYFSGSSPVFPPPLNPRLDSSLVPSAPLPRSQTPYLASSSRTMQDRFLFNPNLSKRCASRRIGGVF